MRKLDELRGERGVYQKRPRSFDDVFDTELADQAGRGDRDDDDGAVEAAFFPAKKQRRDDEPDEGEIAQRCDERHDGIERRRAQRVLDAVEHGDIDRCNVFKHEGHCTGMRVALGDGRETDGRGFDP